MIGVLAVTGIVIVNMSKRNLDAVGRTLRSDIQFAQDLALTNSSVYGFRSINTTSYEIYNGAAGTPATNPLTKGSYVVNISPVVFTGAVPDIPFLSNGQPNIASNATFTLTGDGSTRTITVERFTGYVDLQ